jgi:hypothetical protein
MTLYYVRETDDRRTVEWRPDEGYDNASERSDAADKAIELAGVKRGARVDAETAKTIRDEFRRLIYGN